MDVPYQAPVGGFRDELDLRGDEDDGYRYCSSNSNSKIHQCDEESLEQVPLTPKLMIKDSIANDRFHQRNQSYLAFFRSPIRASRTALVGAGGGEEQRSQVQNLVSPKAPIRAAVKTEESDDDKSDDDILLKRTKDDEGDDEQKNHLRMNLQYSITESQSQSTESSYCPSSIGRQTQASPESRPVFPPGYPPQLARVQLEQSQLQQRMSLGAESRRSNASPRTPQHQEIDSCSVSSSSSSNFGSGASRLFGESLLSGFRGDGGNHDKSRGGVLHCKSSHRTAPSLVDGKRSTLDSEAAAIVGVSEQYHNYLNIESTRANNNSSSISCKIQQQFSSFRRREWLGTIDPFCQVAQKQVKEMIKQRHHVPLSPHSKNLHDLEFLQAQHAQKMEALIPNGQGENDEPVYDFCLVLTPQEVYAFWAALLDFRVELLGQEVVDALEEYWDQSLSVAPGSEKSDAHDIENQNTSPITSRTTASAHRISRGGGEGHEPAIVRSSATTPRQRRSPLVVRSPNQNDAVSSQSKPNPPRLSGSNNRPPLHKGKSTATLTPSLTPSVYGTPSGRSPRLSAPSPSIYSVGECTQMSRTSRGSLFDRAVGGVSQCGSADYAEDLGNGRGSEELGNAFNGSIRRKWGNSKPTSNNRTGTDGISEAGSSSPVVKSITRGTAVVRRQATTQLDINAEQELEQVAAKNRDPHVIRMEDIPNQVIPRGIAARTNGMLPFLSALRRGIVLRRHRPGHVAMYCRLFSADGGDTIQYHWVDQETAMAAFADQRKRYGKDDSFTHPIPWAQTQTYEPRTGKRGSFKTADIVVVMPARHQDPRSNTGEHGSSTLRKSRSDYFEEQTFTLVCRARPNGLLEDYEAKWYRNEGSESLFRYLDFEAATEGDYWIVFRGLLLLHRDAAVGRFAEHRAAGIGSSYGRSEREECSDQIHVDEFSEPVTAGWMEKLIVKWRGLDSKYMVGDRAVGAVPPPSDFFLGFKSPGTSIWSRLRYAGLYTQRLYAIDTNRVILKISCPGYRLMDVAEVLKLKVKTNDGKSFAPFRQDLVDMFKPLDDPLEQGGSNSSPGDFLFSSADRQTIIDFIIRSRIRDSGAELGEATVKRVSGLDSLGRMIQARVPLHMPGKLEVIFQAWVFYWKPEHWRDGRDGTSLTHNPKLAGERKSMATLSNDGLSDEPSERGEKEDQIPSLFVRLIRGAFYQPLTSIEEYFGEKVAFYFAWLQHTAMHLVFLTAAGLIVFIAQVSSGNWDTPLRPYWSVFVMIWTFVVLVNWKKRENFLAYEWGTMNLKEQETTRPQFTGEFVKDEITGEDVLFYPKWKRWLKYSISFPITLLFTSGTLFTILWVHANRDIQLARYLDRDGDFKLEFGISALGKQKPIVELELSRENLFDPVFWFLLIGMPAMLGLCLPLLNFILMRISVLLNNFENYRTVSEYRTHLIIKVFSFRFISHFAVAYYYCFVYVGSKQAIENGFLRVAAAVLVYTTVARWWENFLHIAFPIIIRRLRMRNYGMKLGEQLRDIELEEEAIQRLLASQGNTEELKKRHVAVVNRRLLLDQAQDGIWLELMKPQHDSFPEYIQAIVQFTFVSCFSVVLPVTPLICLINYLISMRLDAYKLCKGRMRPLAEKTGGIGVWEHVLHIVAVISVLTNCWLVGFTSEQFIRIGEQVGQVSLFAIVVCWEHVMLLIKYIMQSSVSPLPKSVQDAMKRQKFERDELRNKSMRKRRRRRTQFDRASLGSRQAPDDDKSVTSSVATGSLFEELPGPSLTPMAEQTHRSGSDTDNSELLSA